MQKRGILNLYETESGQWISDGGAAYPLFNLPSFDEETLCKAFDITDKQAEKIHFRIEYNLPTGISFDDTTDEETVCTRGSLVLRYAGLSMIPYMTSQGIAFIDERYLHPLVDIEDMLNLFERHTPSGEIYFAAKTGYLLMAIIFPINVIDQNFVELLKALTQQCSIALFNKKSSPDNTDEEPQLDIFTDSDRLEMTESEIMKALECCTAENFADCDKCPCDGYCNTGDNMLLNNIIDLLNRKNADLR